MRAVTSNGGVRTAQSSKDEFIRRIGSVAGESQRRHGKAGTVAAQPPPCCYCSQRRNVSSAVDVYHWVILRCYRAGNVQNISVRVANLKLDAANTLTHIRRRLQILQANL